MYKWILPSLSEILAESQSVDCASSSQGQRQWCMSIAAAEQLLLNSLATDSSAETQGLVLAAPAPVFATPRLTQSLQTITFTAKPFNPLALMPFQMPVQKTVEKIAPHESVLPLLKSDPLAKEQFCLIFTKNFCLVLVLADERGEKKFSFSFEPEVVQQAWRLLGARVVLSNPDFFAHIEELVQKYPPVYPDYRIVMQFSQLLLTELPKDEDKEIKRYGETQTYSDSPGQGVAASPRPDVELLQAFAHEVRTPLTTIRTMTKLLLKQQDLSANTIKRLKIIDRECTAQIDRMELLFRAAELQTSEKAKSPAPLTPTCLDDVLRASIPRWQDAANQRNLTLDVVLPQHLPSVVSNPTMLDRVLTGLIENFTRSLPAGSHIQVQVIQAGDQLKLQMLPQYQGQENGEATASRCTPPIRKAIGQLLVFQPETGTISLNLAATKHLFQAIGGKLIVRDRPQQGEVLTIYLPLDGVKSSAYLGVGDWHKNGFKSDIVEVGQ